MNVRNLSYRLVALCLVVAVLHVPVTLCVGVSADSAERMKLTGELTVFGLAKVDGELAISGQTLFSGSKIETAQDATTFISLGARGRFSLLGDSSLSLSFYESSLLCSLNAGSTHVSVPQGIKVNVETKDALVFSDDAQPAVFSVGFWNDDLIVAVSRGRVELSTKERTRQVSAGQFAFAEDNAQAQSRAKKKLNRRKLAAILLPIGGALAILAFVFARGDSSSRMSDFGGCITTLSPTTNPQCP
jgi:ferric-dicitrate binding protein FerR (iron transport regulator)